MPRFLPAAAYVLALGLGGALSAQISSKPLVPGVGSWPEYRGGGSNQGCSQSKRPDWSRLELRWKYWTGSFQTSTPAVFDGCVYVCTEDGDMHCVDAATGEGKWKVLCTTQRGPGNGVVFSSPLVSDGCAFVGNRRGQIWCIDLQTGTSRWHWQSEGRKPEIFSSPKRGPAGIVVGVADEQGANGAVVCLDPASGELLWRTPTGREVGSTPSIFGDRIYVSCKDRKLYEINGAHGTVLRTLALPGTTHCTPALGMGYAFLTTQKPGALAMDLVSGEIRWQLDGSIDEKVSPAFSNGVAYFSAGRDVWAVQGSTGERLWSFSAGHKLAPPCVVGNEVLVTGRDGWFRVVGSDGKEIFGLNLGEPFVAGPILVDGVVYACSDVNEGHHLFALGEPQ